MYELKTNREYTMKQLALAAAVAVASVGAAHAQSLLSHEAVDFATASPSGTWYPVAATLSEMTNEAFEGQPISVVPAGGGVSNPLSVGTGQAGFGISYAPFLKLAQEGGNDMYAEGFPKLRAIAGMTWNALHIITADDIDFPAALAAGDPLVIGTGATGSTEQFTMDEVLKAYDTTREGVTEAGGRVELLNTSGRSDGWSNRQFDVVNFFISMPASAVTSLMTTRSDSRILDIEENVAQQMIDDWGMGPITIPAGTYPNQDEDALTVGMPYVAFTTADMDEEIVYQMAKAAAEGQERLANTQSTFASWDPSKMMDGLGIELHEGAKRYYRERGWIE